MGYYINAMHSREKRFTLTCSAHASDTLILFCEDRNQCRAWSKRCDKSWYSVMIMLRNVACERNPVDLPNSIPKYPSTSFESYHLKACVGGSGCVVAVMIDE